MSCRCPHSTGDVGGLVDDMRSAGDAALVEWADKLDRMARWALRLRNGWRELANRPQGSPAYRAAAETAEDTRRAAAAMKNWMYDAARFLGVDMSGDLGIPVPIAGVATVAALAAWYGYQWRQLAELQAQLDHELALLAGAAGATDPRVRDGYLGIAARNNDNRNDSGWTPYVVGGGLALLALFWARREGLL